MKQFAYVDDGGAVRSLSPDEAAAFGPCHLAWIHLDLADPDTRSFLADRLQLSDLVVTALTATETRPRCEPMAEGALVNLRGLAAEGEEDIADPLISIRMWIGRGRIVSMGRYTLRAMPHVCKAMQAGHVKDPGDFVAMLASCISQELDPHVAEYGDRLDECELGLDASKAFVLRREIGGVRAKAIQYRRFVAPQRQALERLSNLECSWLEADDRQHLIEAADRFSRMTEELESIRERAALMHEQITDLHAEQTEQRGLLVSVLALIFLPLTFLTGLFGMNVALPYEKAPWAFNAILSLSAAVVIGGIGYFLRARWFR